MNNISLWISVAMLLASAFWGSCTAQAFWFPSDDMIGFSPFVLFSPFVILAILSFSAGVWSATRSKVLCVAAVFSIALVLLPLMNGHRITKTAWNRSLNRNSKTNRAAIEATDFAGARYDLSTTLHEQQMVPVSGFAWYCEQHISAPNGEFRGFSCNGIPHVYVRKVRHGYSGVAWIPDPAKIPSHSTIEYEQTDVRNWYLWTWGG